MLQVEVFCVSLFSSDYAHTTVYHYNMDKYFGFLKFVMVTIALAFQEIKKSALNAKWKMPVSISNEPTIRTEGEEGIYFPP